MMRTLGVLVICALSITAVAAIAAQAPARPARNSIAERYEQARQTLEHSRAQETATQAERDRLHAEARAIAQRMVVNAARVQELEAERAQSARELERLSYQARVLETELAVGRDKVARLLAIMQRVDYDQPPALALRPDDSLSAARGVMLVGTLLKPVYSEAHALAVKLRTLQRTRTAIEQKRIQARNEEIALSKARISLAALQVQRTQEAQRANIRLGELHVVTQEIAQQAGDLKTLIDRIATVRRQGSAAVGMVVVTAADQTGQTLKPGALRRPVVGVMTSGDPSGPGSVPGSVPRGLWFDAAGGAQVVAPTDSEVVFAGPYQKFGNVLILEVTGGYHLLLAGMGRIDVRIGDLMLAGEPVGVVTAGQRAKLYLELRHQGQTVNVAPWMSAELRRARGS